MLWYNAGITMRWGVMKKTAPGFFDVSTRLKELSKCNDPLEKLSATIDFEVFRSELETAFAFHRGKAGRPAYDAILILKILVLQSLYDLSDDQIEYQVKDRLSFMRFLNLELHHRVPDAKTIWLYRERLKRKKLLPKLFAAFDEQLANQGYIAMGGTIVDASIVQAPRQKFTQEEKGKIKNGEVPENWSKNKAAQKDTDARYTLKHTKKKPGADLDLVIPYHGYKTHVGIDNRYGFIRTQIVTSASAYDGHCLEDLIDPNNSCADVYADTAYRTAANEEMLKAKGMTSKIHRKKQRGKPMNKNVAKGNSTKSKIRAKVEHVFAVLKDQMNLFIRTIGLKRAEVKIGLAHLAYNFKRLVFWETRNPQPQCA